MQPARTFVSDDGEDGSSPTRRYDLYYDMGAVVAAGLYKEVKTRAGPEVMKQIQAKVRCQTPDRGCGGRT